MAPPVGRGIGDDAVRGGPPKSEERRPKRLVGRQDPALILGMRVCFVGQQESRPGDHATGTGGQRRARIGRCRYSAGQQHRSPRGDLKCPRQERRRASVASEMPAGFTTLGDEPVGAPVNRPACLLLAADHGEHEHPGFFELP